MEHRCTGRLEASLDVVIHNRKGKHLDGRLRNVSREGMYIRTRPQRIRKGEIVDIEITHDCCIRGWVAHVGSEGIGILFVSTTPIETSRSTPPVPLPDACLNCLKIDSQPG